MDINPAMVMQAITLLFVVLAFSFGRGDKSAAKVEALEEKQHLHELAMKDMEARLRDHVGGGYATKADIATIREEIASFRAMFEPIASQLTVKAARGN